MERNQAGDLAAHNHAFPSERSRDILRMIVTAVPAPGRITGRALAKAISVADAERHYEKIRSYLADEPVRPQLDAAWAIGEALATIGLPWASGLWMLFVAGRLEHFVGVLGTYLESPERDIGHVRLLWRLVAQIEYLCAFSGDTGTQFAVRTDQRRSDARRTWMEVAVIRSDLERAFETWRSSKPWPRSDKLQAALSLSHSKHGPFYVRLDGVLILIAHAFADVLHPEVETSSILDRDGNINRH